ncbi:MAG: Smr/MutS family protein [Dehalococcoidia bacterium]
MSLPESEVMLRHLPVDEALIKMDKFLNQSYDMGLYTVRVIHGKGSGTLRLETRRELAHHPLVESFRPAESWEGGTGATIVRLISR